jgi:preprotein translocase subunit YajC
MSSNVLFIAVAALGLLLAIFSLVMLFIARKSGNASAKVYAGLAAGLIILAGGIAGTVISLQNHKIVLANTYFNSDYGIGFKYPDGWKKTQDSLNPAIAAQPIDTLQSLYVPGDGESKVVSLQSFGGVLLLTAPPGQNVISVYKNTGNATDPVWAPLTVGIEGVDAPGTKDCLWSTDNRTITFASPLPLMNRAARIDYAVTGWSSFVVFVSPDLHCFFVVDISRLGNAQPYGAWSQAWQAAPKTNAGKPPDYQKFLSSGNATIGGISGLYRAYTDNQVGGRECKDYTVPANSWAYEILTSTSTPAKYSDWQATINAMIASIQIFTPVSSQ